MMTAKPYDVLTFGDLCVDLILSGRDVTPQFGQVEKLVDDYTLELGGSCCIFACQSARLNLRTNIIGKIGDDDFGRFAKRRLDESGVDTRHLAIDPHIKTGFGVALSQGNDRAILTYLGSITAVTGADAHPEIIRAARHLHHGSYFLHQGLLPAVPAIFKQAKENGLSTSLDTNWDPNETWSENLLEVFPYTDLFMPNEQEAQRITGLNDLDGAARWLLQKGVGAVIIKRGEKGARYYDGKSVLDVQVTPVTDGDSVGAGDCFDAGFLAGWLRGLSIQTCLEIGAYCGSAVASKCGGLAGQPNWGDELSTLVRLN